MPVAEATRRPATTFATGRHGSGDPMTSRGVRLDRSIRFFVDASASPLAPNVAGLAMLLVLIAVGAGLLPDGAPRNWWSPLAGVELSLAAGDVQAAVRQWHEARAEAAAARHWEGLIEVGDAYRRIGMAGGFTPAADVTARALYLAALSSARGQASVDGALRAADAFAGLGEPGLVEVSLGVAARIAGDDADEQARVRRAARRTRARSGATAR